MRAAGGLFLIKSFDYQLCSALHLGFSRGKPKEMPAPHQKCEQRLGESPLIAGHCRSRISSIAALPPLSTLTTLWIGLKPVSVISTM